MVNLCHKIKQVRMDKRMTQLQLAEQLGVTKSMVSAYETATRHPSYEVLVKIAQIFNVSTDYLLGLCGHATIDVSGLSERQMEILLGLVEEFRKEKH